jgi:glyceraldehyde-3-phosphate dehydrogenase (NADP+)
MGSCTALKNLYVHESIADEFNKRFAAKVDALTFGIHGTNQCFDAIT